MNVNKTIEGPGGAITFQGELNPDEVEFLITYAINTLMLKGALPFAIAKEEDIAAMAPGSDTLQ